MNSAIPAPELSSALIEQENHNFRHLVADIGWYGLALPAVSSFLSIYAINLGADAIALGLLSSLPAIAMLLGTFFTEWWSNRYTDIMRAQLGPAFVMRLRVLLLAVVPLLPVPWRVPALIAIMTVPGVAMSVASVVFMVIMQTAVTRRRFTALVSRRQLAMNLSIAGSTLLLGVWLEKVAFPLNYQIMFVVLFTAMLISLWHVLQVRPLPEDALTTAPEAIHAPSPPSARPWRVPVFRRIALLIGGVFTAYFSILSIIPLRLVNDLGASEGFIAIYSFLELIGAASMAYFAPRLVERFGHRNLVTVTMAITGLSAIILAIAPDRMLVLPAALINGAAWTATDITQFSFYSQAVPEARKTAFSNAYYQAISVAIFIGPLIGSLLVTGGIALPTVLLIGAGLRITSGWLMHTYRAPQPVTTVPEVQTP
ncbi:MAG: MFS transporter [Anaerolineae bacterium]